MECLGCVGSCLGVARCLCMDVGNSNQKVLFGFAWGQDSVPAYWLVCGLHYRTSHFPPPFILRNLFASLEKNLTTSDFRAPRCHCSLLLPVMVLVGGSAPVWILPASDVPRAVLEWCVRSRLRHKASWNALGLLTWQTKVNFNVWH